MGRWGEMVLWIMGIVLVELLLMFLRCSRAVEHPVFEPSGGGNVERLKKHVAKVMALDEEELLARIPDRSGFIFVGCPNCQGGSQENQLTWTLDDPEHVRCRYCGMVFPNETYPDTSVLRVTNPVGRTQEYPYWENESGYRYFFRAKGWYQARSYFAGIAYDLARLYHLTRDPIFARRAGAIVHRFAEVYPGYCVTNDYPARQKSLFEKDEPPYPYWGGKWSRWFYGDIPTDLTLAYDLICEGEELENVDADAHRCIEEDLLRASVEFVKTYPIYLGNMDPTILRGMVAVGRVIGEPDFVHDAVARMTDLVRKRFFFDGMWKEGTVSYHNQTVGGLRRVLNLLKGYSDPPGYRSPRDGRHFENLDLVQDLPILRKAVRMPERLRYPDGKYVPVHDAWAGSGMEPKDRTGPMLLPAMGHARLGRGTGVNQIEVHLHFSGGYGHQHRDNLSLTLFAKGHELFPDLGYTHTRYRRWSTSTLAHNTVMVDGKEQHAGSEEAPSDGDLLLYVPGNDTFQAVEADGARAYPGIVRTYRRLVILIGASERDAYALDLFRAAGGERHEWALHGDADRDGRLISDLRWAAYGPNLLPPGVAATMPKHETDAGSAGAHNVAYALVRNVRRADVEGYWSATFEVPGAEEAVRVHALAVPGTEVFAGEAPSLRRAREDEGKLDAFTMPMLIARRSGADLSSTFVSVLEPYEGEPFIHSVERLSAEGDPDAVAVKVTYGETADFLICRTEGMEDTEVRVGDLRMRGRIGFVRERNGRVEEMALVGGTYLRKGTSEVTSSGPVSGTIRSVHRKVQGAWSDAFEVDAEMPEGTALSGATMIVTHPDGFTHGYEIASVAEREGCPFVELKDDPGFEITPEGATRFVYYPHRESRGENRFYVSNFVYRRK